MTAHDLEAMQLRLVVFRDEYDLSTATFAAVANPRLGVVETVLQTGEYRRTLIVDQLEYDTLEAAALALAMPAPGSGEARSELPDGLLTAASPRLAAALDAVGPDRGGAPAEEVGRCPSPLRQSAAASRPGGRPAR